MTPVDQAVMHDPDDPDAVPGDCTRACVASLLDLELDQVPHVVHNPTGYLPDRDPLTERHGALWWRRLRRFLRTNHDLDVAAWEVLDTRGRTLEVRQADGHPWEGHVLLGGPSPRGPFGHLVVGAYRWVPTGRPGRLRPTVEVVHDPHPSRSGLVRIADLSVLLPPYDPAPPAGADDLRAVADAGALPNLSSADLERILSDLSPAR